MKRKFVLGLLGLILGLMATATLSSCDKKSALPATQEYVDESVQTALQDFKASFADPEFKSVQDVLDYRRLIMDEEDIDGVFKAMDANILGEVGGVLLKRGTACTKKSIVQEYISHADVYDNLTPDPEPDKTAEPAVEEQPRPSDSVATTATVSSKDTVIDGKKAKVTTHISYE